MFFVCTLHCTDNQIHANFTFKKLQHLKICLGLIKELIHFKDRKNRILKLRPNKKICMFMVKCQKNLGSVGINFLLLLSAKPEIVVPVSGISFSRFPVSRHLLKLFYDELQFFYLLCSQFRQKAIGWINKNW